MRFLDATDVDLVFVHKVLELLFETPSAFQCIILIGVFSFVLPVALLPHRLAPHPLAPRDGWEGLPVAEDGPPRGEEPGAAPAW